MSNLQPRQAKSSEDADTRFSRNVVARAVSSPDGMYVAAIASSSEIHIRRCPSQNRETICYTAVVSSRQAQEVLAHANMLQWSPEVMHSTDGTSTRVFCADSESNLFRTWLLVSDGQRLIIFCIELDLYSAPETSCTILSDFGLGTHLGRLSFADFVFSHEYAIVLPVMGIQASILSLTRPERHDIANIKYSDTRAFAISRNHKYFSVLTRSEGQDLILVFTTSEMESLKSNSFFPLTYDAQGLKWCPNGDPLLCIWDSASFGLKVSFFTANGHHLKQMDLNSSTINLPSNNVDFEGLGVNTVDWLTCDGDAILAVFNSSSQLLLRRESGAQKLGSPLVAIDHQRIVDGTAYHVWQESEEGRHFFTPCYLSFEPRHVERLAGADQIAMNGNCQLLATKDSSRPWTLWIWDVRSSEHLAVVTFRHRIKQLLWHPTNLDLLLILAVQKEPLLYVWHAAKQQMLIAERPIMTTDAETADYQCKWLKGDLEGLPLLFVGSFRRYDAGIIRLLDQGGVIFESVLQERMLGHDLQS